MKLKFSDKIRFNLALSILNNNLESGYEINSNSMIVTFKTEEYFKWGISELSVAQIWDKPSFHGEADFKIIK